MLLDAAVQGENAVVVPAEQQTGKKGLELSSNVLRFASVEQPAVDQTDVVVSKIARCFAASSLSYLRQLFPQAKTIKLAFTKLSICREGEHIAEQDAAQAPSHQGTLLLEVKSAHTGGQLSFKMGEETIDWDLTEQCSASLVNKNRLHWPSPIRAHVSASLLS